MLDHPTVEQFHQVDTISEGLYGAIWCLYGVYVVIETVTEKIGTTEWITVRKHARTRYLPLSSNLAGVFDIEPGDQIKVKLLEIKRADRGE